MPLRSTPSCASPAVHHSIFVEPSSTTITVVAAAVFRRDRRQGSAHVGDFQAGDRRIEGTLHESRNRALLRRQLYKVVTVHTFARDRRKQIAGSNVTGIHAHPEHRLIDAAEGGTHRLRDAAQSHAAHHRSYPASTSRAIRESLKGRTSSPTIW